jgi:hypothetical protein
VSTPSPAVRHLNFFSAEEHHNNDEDASNGKILNEWEPIVLQEEPKNFKEGKAMMMAKTGFTYAIHFKSKEKIKIDEETSIHRYQVLKCLSHFDCPVRVYDTIYIT